MTRKVDDYESLRSMLLHCGTFLSEAVALRELARFARLAQDAGHQLESLAAFVSVGVTKRASVALAPRAYFLRLEAGALGRQCPRRRWLLDAGVVGALRVCIFCGSGYRFSALSLGAAQSSSKFEAAFTGD